jgi:hypothetical protein
MMTHNCVQLQAVSNKNMGAAPGAGIAYLSRRPKTKVFTSAMTTHSIIGIMLWYWKQRRNEIQLSIVLISLLLPLVKVVVKPWICEKDLV